MRRLFSSTTTIWIVAMSLVVSAAVVQSSPQGQQATQETQARGIWTDPFTKLMWAAKDNGKDVCYNGALNYCRDLRLAGYSDWRLATLDELQTIYDKTANAPGLAGPHSKEPNMWHVKGNLFLTGHPFAQNLSGHTGGGLGFDFNEGRPTLYEGRFLWTSCPFRRALCVRDSAPPVQEPTSEIRQADFWTDPSTNLLWTAKDNGKDVKFNNAVNYCRDLRLAGYSDWRLPIIGELQGIYDKTANAPGLAGRHGELRMLWHVKGNLFLTGYQWAYRAGKWGDDVFTFDDGESGVSEATNSSSFLRALCVRGSGK